MKRIVVFTASTGFTVRKGIAELAKRFPETYFLVLRHRPPKPIGRLVRNQWRNLQRNGWRWVFYQTAEIAALAQSRWTKDPWHSDTRPGRGYAQDALFDSPSLQLETTDNIHGKKALARVRAFEPDLGLSIAAPILKPELFEIPRCGTLNLHKGKLPFYRGTLPAFWEIINGEDAIGCTIHRVDKGLDTGEILLEASVPRQRYSTVAGLQLQLDELGIQMMCDAVALVADGRARWQPQAEGGKTYLKPTLKQEAMLARQERKRATIDSPLRRGVKDGASIAYAKYYAPLQRRLRAARHGANEVVVLLYHRVNDELRDSVTVGIAQFEQQMAYLARHYPLASIEDILDDHLPSRPLGQPIVAVTFDDGYYDNYANAVPALLKHGIPAAFFVSTGMIGQNRGFPHDLEKLGRALPNMDWAHLREMRGHGFTIGSHTVSHANCGQLSGQALERELVASRDHLKAELGLERVIFAYPYGKKTDITPQGVALVREVGYSGCLSAYGGVNHQPVDSFNVLRKGVDYNFGPRRFAARVQGW